MGELYCRKSFGFFKFERYGVKESEELLVRGLGDSHIKVVIATLRGLMFTPVPSAVPAMLVYANHSNAECRRRLASVQESIEYKS